MNDDVEYTSYYEDSTPAAEPEKAPAETFDASKYVPREEHAKLENQFQQMQPYMQQMQQLQSVFSPQQQQQQPQLSPEQQALTQHIQQTAIAPLQAQIEQFELAQAGNIVKELGFNDINDAATILDRITYQMSLKSQQGNAAAKQFLDNLKATKGALATTQYVKSSMPFLQQMLSDTDLQHHPAFKANVMRQGTIGHSLGSNSYSQPNQKPINEQIEEARRAGNWAEADRLRKDWGRQVNQQLFS